MVRNEVIGMFLIVFFSCCMWQRRCTNRGEEVVGVFYTYLLYTPLYNHEYPCNGSNKIFDIYV